MNPSEGSLPPVVAAGSHVDRLQRMHIQLWSYNYAPEPTGIAPVSTALAEGLAERGHDVAVVAAHPHYPEPRWGSKLLPYRETQNGISVLRLPLWIGRASTAARIRQELTFAGSLFAALPFVGRPDVIVAASPSFPALLPAIAYSRVARVPLVPWLQDILPEGAMVTEQVQAGPLLKVSQLLECATYRTAKRIVVVSRPFVDNLLEKGVPESKLALIYNPATRPFPAEVGSGASSHAARVICMGNIGHTQGLAPLVRAFDRSSEVHDAAARLIITGSGVAAKELRHGITSDAVQMLGVVSDEQLDRELQGATLAMVSQQYQASEFNLPSKVMNYMAYGLPIIAVVNPQSEVARLVRESGSGWVIDSATPEEFPRTIMAAVNDHVGARKRGLAGLQFARQHFTRDAFAAAFECLLMRAGRR